MLNLLRSKQWRSLSMITLGVTAAIVGVQLTGGLQGLEWAIFNQWVRLRPPENKAVPIIVVTLTEKDIQWMRRWPLSDAQLAALLNRLKRDRPAAIGLNLYRDLPVEPGHPELLQVFKTTPNLIGITKAVGNSEGAAVAPPPILRDRDQVGVNDLLIDADGTVRRNLLSIDRRGKEAQALGTKLALMYLSKQGITPTVRATDGCIQVGKATFCRLEHNAGGYIRVDTGGYQTLSNFLQISGGIPSVSLTEVMANRVPASLFQDKIVLIGTKADSVWGDRFYTPYTTDSNSTWVGVEIHANLTAQIISSALEGRPILQGLPQAWEWGWIVLWAGVGTLLGWSIRTLPGALVFISIAVISILAMTYGLFLVGWWAIAVSPVLALIGSAFLSRNYWVWHTLKQANQLLELKVQERTQELMDKNAALEQASHAAETANQTLHHLARTDELTQVANRRFFNEYLEQEWHRMLQAQLPLALVLIDIDFFKLYNDTYGHPAGDVCLAKVASSLKLTVKRPDDLVARYGGEEFIIILPNTPLAGAMQVATAIQSHIRFLQIPHRCSQISPWLTLSMGVACIVPTSQTSPAYLVDKVDQALYQAKRAGRDRAISEELFTQLTQPVHQLLD
ncbi:MAG: hypothetical protein DCF22_21955 [Leptolyngbya sp.]|nr:MAG: hypothetical protein DCF22_21955 [Leptolyngbya sp.]